MGVVGCHQKLRERSIQLWRKPERCKWSEHKASKRVQIFYVESIKLWFQKLFDKCYGILFSFLSTSGHHRVTFASAI